MEENRVETTTSGTLVSEEEDAAVEGYVSPDVLAAMNGERVEFGHDLTTDEDQTDSDN